ncbi:MAG: ATP-binding protein [Spirochaetota bacterium]
MRYIKPYVLEDLASKMVFIGGPRQAGKTTLSQNILRENYVSGLYLNYDFDEHRNIIQKRSWQESQELLVFDEIHKFYRWKNWLKGIYDIQKEQHKFLVTGSARLDVYKRGGDSLLGRYHYWRLHPFTLQEVPNGISPQEALKRLLQLGGFPEPFLKGSERFARRWRRERFDKIIKDDIRDLEPLKNFSALQVFAESLRTRVGSLLVKSNIANDLHVSPHTITHWLEVLEKMYLIFTIYPYTKGLGRSIQKPAKVYFFDNGDVEGDEGAILENLVATHLLKRIHFREDYEGYSYQLKYIRDKDGREVDFVIVRNKTVEELIEIKVSDESVSKNLSYFSKILKPERTTQLVLNLKQSYEKDGIHVEPVLDYFVRDAL